MEILTTNISNVLNGNNGSQLAEIMHRLHILKDNMSLDDCERAARVENIVGGEQHNKWLQKDDFWEDFNYRAEELGYKLKL